MNRAVFLDRDGVITQEPPHYAHRLSQLELISQFADAIKAVGNSGPSRPQAVSIWVYPIRILVFPLLLGTLLVEKMLKKEIYGRYA